MKYLVTGGAGFIGSYVVNHLIENRHSVDIIDNLRTENKEIDRKIFDKVNFFQVDITDKEELSEIIKDYDGIFHEAGLTSVTESFKKTKEYEGVNVGGTKNLFEIAKKQEIRIVFASSASIYGDSKKIPIKEDSEREPINPYGKTKFDAEILAKKYSDLGLQVIGLRYFNVYGKGQTSTYAGVITKFLENIKLKKPFTIYGDGFQFRDFIHVKDIASANLAVMNSNVNSGFFNVGTGKSTSINELAEIMVEISGHKEGINHVEPLEGDIKASLADMSSMHKSFEWNHSINLRNGLKKLIQDYL